METPSGHTCSDPAEESEDPGAAPYGNFINYYTFNPPENRLGLIPPTLLQDIGLNPSTETILMLDVGCNSGDLSIGLFKHLLQDQRDEEPPRTVHMLGCDLDDALIDRARNSNPFPRNVEFVSLDITEGEGNPELRSYLENFGRGRFHLCCCFAVTMWVHLNHGDAALLALLSRLSSLSQYLLLEVQPWKCYRSAARRLRRLGRRDFDHFRALEIRGDMAAHAAEHLETRCGMQLVRSFGSTAWDRSLMLFRNR